MPSPGSASLLPRGGGVRTGGVRQAHTRGIHTTTARTAIRIGGPDADHHEGIVIIVIVHHGAMFARTSAEAASDGGGSGRRGSVGKLEGSDRRLGGKALKFGFEVFDGPQRTADGF